MIDPEAEEMLGGGGVPKDIWILISWEEGEVPSICDLGAKVRNGGNRSV